MSHENAIGSDDVLRLIEEVVEAESNVEGDALKQRLSSSNLDVRAMLQRMNIPPEKLNDLSQAVELYQSDITRRLLDIRTIIRGEIERAQKPQEKTPAETDTVIGGSSEDTIKIPKPKALPIGFRQQRENMGPLTDDQIFGGVQEALVDALGVDDHEVMMESSLVNDLGAQSIDFLDIVFRLERQFDIQIPRLQLFPEAEQNGPLTKEEIASLKEKVPDGYFDYIEREPFSNSVSTIFTVRSVVRHITTLLREAGR